MKFKTDILIYIVCTGSGYGIYLGEDEDNNDISICSKCLKQAFF